MSLRNDRAAAEIQVLRHAVAAKEQVIERLEDELEELRVICGIASKQDTNLEEVWVIVADLRRKVEAGELEKSKLDEKIAQQKEMLQRTRDRVNGVLHAPPGASTDNIEDRCAKAEWRVTILEQEVERLEGERIDALTEAAEYERLASDMQDQMEKIRAHAKEAAEEQAGKIKALEESRAAIIEERDDAIKQVSLERSLPRPRTPPILTVIHPSGYGGAQRADRVEECFPKPDAAASGRESRSRLAGDGRSQETARRAPKAARWDGPGSRTQRHRAGNRQAECPVECRAASRSGAELAARGDQRESEAEATRAAWARRARAVAMSTATDIYGLVYAVLQSEVVSLRLSAG